MSACIWVSMCVYGCMSVCECELVHANVSVCILNVLVGCQFHPKSIPSIKA